MFHGRPSPPHPAPSRLDLSSQAVLNAIFGVLRVACAFNSTGLDTSGAANATVPKPLVSAITTLS